LKLDIGAAFFGTVMTGKLPGQPQTVNSPYGQLLLKLNQNLPQNAQLGFKLQALNPQPQLLITSINGKPVAGLPGGNPQAATAAGAQVSGAAGLASTAAVTVGSGSLITATVLTPGAAQWAKGGGTPQAGAAGKAAASVPGQMLSGPSATPGTTPGTPAASSSPATPGTPSAQSSAQGQSSTPSAAPTSAPITAQTALRALMAGGKPNLPAGLQLEVKIAGENPTASAQATQGAKGAAPAPSTPGGVSLTGTVTGATPQGQPIVQTSSGYLALATKVPLEPGSKITLDVPAAQSALKVAPPMPNFDQIGGRTWPNLQEAVDLLKQAAPAVADQVASAAIPKPDTAMGNTMVFFMAALRVGSIRNWLGDAAMRVLERERPGLLPRLGDDFKKSSKNVNDPNSGDWKITMVPIDTGQSINQVAMCMKDSSGEDDENNSGKGNGTRFIIDVELTQYGRMQLDGLSKEEDRKFDLVIRTAAPLPSEMRKDINTLFTRSSEGMGLTGQLVFLGTANFVEIEGIDIKKDTLGMIV